MYIWHYVFETQRRESRKSMVKLPVELPLKPALSSHPHQHTNDRNNALVHLFLHFSSENGNEDVLIRDYLEFSHALHPPAGDFSKLIFVLEILKSNCGRTIPTLTVILLHLFFGFSAETGNEDVPSQDYF